MPVLQNPRYEAFAQARAKGMLLMDAYESAGFVRHSGHPSRLAVKDEVARRIAELRARQTDLQDVSPIGLLASLRRIIRTGELSESPALINAARLAIVDASRLQAALVEAQAAEQWRIEKEYKALATAQAGEAPPEGRTDRPDPPRQAPVAAPASPRHRPVIAPRSPRARPPVSSPAPRRLPSGATSRVW